MTDATDREEEDAGRQRQEGQGQVADRRGLEAIEEIVADQSDEGSGQDDRGCQEQSGEEALHVGRNVSSVG